MKREFDLYKWIILGSLLLLPVAGGVLYWLHKRIAEGERAIDLATRRNGDLQTIGRLLVEIDNQAKSAGTASAEDPGVYFDRQISRSSQDPPLKRNDYKIDPVSAMPNRDTKSIDRLYKIEFKRDGKQYALPRALVEAVLFNIEANSPAWRLRYLTLRNETTGANQMRVSGIKPPPEIEDSWLVDKLEFARREPDTSAASRRNR